MTAAIEGNCDGLVGPTHSFAGLAPGNLASEHNKGDASNPRGAVLEGLSKMRLLADLGLPQFVLPPHERPDVGFLRAIGFAGTDARVIETAARQAPKLLNTACSASAMWAANAATVTPSADAADGGAANHVRLCADHGESGVNLFAWGREAWETWQGRFPARQTLQAFEAVARRHGAGGAVFARQARAAIEAGVFHNDVVCVGAKTCLLFHEAAFEDAAAMQ